MRPPSSPGRRSSWSQLRQRPAHTSSILQILQNLRAGVGVLKREKNPMPDALRTRRGHGEGSICQRKSDGRWCAVLDLGWQAGKRHRKWFYGDSRRDVADRLTRALRELQQGIAPADERG